MNSDTVELLNELAQVRAARDLTNINYQDRRKEILAQVQAELADLEAEFLPLLEVAEKRYGELEQFVKECVIREGGSVKGEHLHAVYTSGRTSWDTKKLDGYAAAHPEILTFRKVGEPSVSIRSAK